MRASRRTKRPKRKLMLFPLMDMFFILLLFFLVTSGITHHPPAEAQGFLVRTPKPTVGEAQILLQVVSADSLVWLDNTSFRSDWKDGLIARNKLVIEQGAIANRLGRFRDAIGMCAGRDILTVIRCPMDADYGVVVQLEQMISAAFSEEMPDREAHYSIVEGSVDEIAVNDIKDHAPDRVEITW